MNASNSRRARRPGRCSLKCLVAKARTMDRPASGSRPPGYSLRHLAGLAIRAALAVHRAEAAQEARILRRSRTERVCTSTTDLTTGESMRRSAGPISAISKPSRTRYQQLQAPGLGQKGIHSAVIDQQRQWDEPPQRPSPQPGPRAAGELAQAEAIRHAQSPSTLALGTIRPLHPQLGGHGGTSGGSRHEAGELHRGFVVAVDSVSTHRNAGNRQRSRRATSPLQLVVESFPACSDAGRRGPILTPGQGPT